MTWFLELTGCPSESPEDVRKHLSIKGERLRSNLNGGEWNYGRLETPSLSQLRERALATPRSQQTTFREIVADVQRLHCDPANTGAMFQVASQFNLLEMTSPDVTPEEGVGIYELDFTQGPACAIAAGAGTIFRNYFASVNGGIGQTVQRQIDCLADVGTQLGNAKQQLWQMINGYALPVKNGLATINDRLNNLDRNSFDKLRGALRIGLHIDTQVTLNDASHLVSQAFCSAVPVAYSDFPSDLWAQFATLILEAAYEATICAAIENADRTGNKHLYLTLLGGGAFGNETTWILDAIERAVSIHAKCGLNIAIVSYGRSDPAVRTLTHKLTEAVIPTAT